MFEYLIYGVCLFLASILGHQYYCKAALAQGLLDIPVARSSHSKAKPRGAGLVFVFLWGVFSLILLIENQLPVELAMILMPGAMLNAGTGFLDDCRGIAAKFKLIPQLVSAILFVLALNHFEYTRFLSLDWVGVIFGLMMALCVIWSTNLFNFMDGMDGFAAQEAIFFFLTGAALTHFAGAHALSALALGLVAVLLGFLVWNWPDSKLFMGDVGSCFLGFLVAAFALTASISTEIPFVSWLLIYLLFWFDATVTLFRRFFFGHSVMEAHKLHAYQRLHQAGWSHGEILLGGIFLNSLFSALGLMSYLAPEHGWLLLLIGMAIASGVMLWIERKRPMLA